MIPTLTPFESPTPTNVTEATVTPRLQLPPAPTPAPATLTDIGDMTELVKRAQAEGELSVIGLSREWLNYGEIIESFKNTYGIRVVEQTPDATSTQQIDTIRQTAGQTGIQVPDVVDVSHIVAINAASQGLFQPYRTQVWDDVPDSLKDASGAWTAAYFGVMMFVVNADVVKSPPKGWQDLRNAIYKSQVALPANPHASLTAQYAVMSAALANDGSVDDAMPGIQYFAALRTAGILNDQAGDRNSINIGETPIVPMWSFVAYAVRTSSTSKVVAVLPEPIVGAAYAHAINAYATHPYAARLWLEHTLSNSSQLSYAKAGATPARVAALAADKAIPADIVTRIPAPAKMSKVRFLTPEQLARVSELIATQWDSVVQLTIIK